MHVKKIMCHYAYDTYCLRHWNEKMKERTKASNLIADYFSLTVVNLLLA